jgi:hypothetical protein
MLNQSTCVGLGYGPVLGLFPGHPQPLAQSTKGQRPLDAVTTSGLRNVDLIPIGYGFRPRLRGRLTLRGRTLRRNPWTFGDRDSHPVDRYSCQHLHFRYLQRPSRATFTGLRNAPLPVQLALNPAASVHGLSPGTFSAQDSCSTSELLRFLSRMAASKPTSWLSRPSHILSHLAMTWGP